MCACLNLWCCQNCGCGFIGMVPGFAHCMGAKVLGCSKFQSVVRSMEVARFSEVAFTLSLCKLQSIPQGLSTVERQSTSQRVCYGRLHCNCTVSFYRKTQECMQITYMCGLNCSLVALLILHNKLSNKLRKADQICTL